MLLTKPISRTDGGRCGRCFEQVMMSQYLRTSAIFTQGVNNWKLEGDAVYLKMDNLESKEAIQWFASITVALYNTRFEALSFIPSVVGTDKNTNHKPEDSLYWMIST
jgi:hypothetical protein